MSNLTFIGDGKVLLSDDLKSELNKEPVDYEIVIKMILKEEETQKILEKKYNDLINDFPFAKSFLPKYETIKQHIFNYLEGKKNE